MPNQIKIKYRHEPVKLKIDNVDQDRKTLKKRMKHMVKMQKLNSAITNKITSGIFNAKMLNNSLKLN